VLIILLDHNLNHKVHNNFLMNEKEIGLSIGEKAPELRTTDVYGNKIDSAEILQNNKGLLIDFFRGTW